MAEESRGIDCVTFSRGYDVCIMAIDGTLRRDASSMRPPQRRDPYRGGVDPGPQSEGFFLLLSSTGLAYRRCELVRVNGIELDMQFLKGKNKKKGRGGVNQDAVA